MDELMRTPEVAKRMRVSRHTVVRWVRKGRIGARQLRPRGHLYFRRSEVEALIAGQATGAQPCAARTSPRRPHPVGDPMPQPGAPRSGTLLSGEQLELPSSARIFSFLTSGKGGWSKDRAVAEAIGRCQVK